jgi:hypothetical protein
MVCNITKGHVLMLVMYVGASLMDFMMFGALPHCRTLLCCTLCFKGLTLNIFVFLLALAPAVGTCAGIYFDTYWHLRQLLI